MVWRLNFKEKLEIGQHPVKWLSRMSMDMSRLISPLAIPVVNRVSMFLKRPTEVECSTVRKAVWHQLRILSSVSGCLMVKGLQV